MHRTDPNIEWSGLQKPTVPRWRKPGLEDDYFSHLETDIPFEGRAARIWGRHLRPYLFLDLCQAGWQLGTFQFGVIPTRDRTQLRPVSAPRVPAAVVCVWKGENSQSALWGSLLITSSSFFLWRVVPTWVETIQGGWSYFHDSSLVAFRALSRRGSQK